MASITFPLALISYFAAASVVGSGVSTFQCALSPVLSPSDSMEAAILRRAPVGSLPALPQKLPKEPQLFAGEIPIRKNTAVRVIAVVSQESEPAIYVDANLDGKFTAEERVPPGATGQRLELPIRVGPFKSFPLVVKQQVLTRAQSAQLIWKGTWVLLYSRQAEVRGVLNLSGRPTQIGYALDADRGVIEPRSGWIGMDVNGDGRIDETWDNVECAMARDETIVFKIGTSYYATKAVNLADLTAQIEERPASDYFLIPVKLGAQVPNFPFIDFAGRERHAYDSKARFTLLYFWASWCGPCREESRSLAEIYEQFNRSDLEVIGLSSDETLESAVASHGSMRWAEARPASIEALVRKRFRVEQWPTLILLDREKRIISLGRDGELPLRGSSLRTTLNKLLRESASD